MRCCARSFWNEPHFRASSACGQRRALQVPAHPLQPGDLRRCSTSACASRGLPVQGDAPALQWQRCPDLLRRQTGRLAEADQREPFQHLLVVLPAQARRPSACSSPSCS